MEEGKDHGQNIREKAKAFVALLRDEDRFKNERTKALAAKERFALNTGAPPVYWAPTGGRREGGVGGGEAVL